MARLTGSQRVGRFGHGGRLDALIVACAHQAGGGVLHYDRDYDVIAARTSLEFESRWLAPAASL